jgi:predicted Zn-dependent peptidase
VLTDQSQVYFIPKKKSPQTRIEAMVLCDKMTDIPTRYTSFAAGRYFGGGMGSVLFQEIREFRSMAYSTSASILKQHFCARDRTPSYLKAFVGTQGDKTVDAMNVLDSLIRHLPVSEKRFEATRINMWSSLVTSYPTFRVISREIASILREGYTSDPTKDDYAILEQMTMDDISNLWKQQVSDRNIVWAVVGDPDKIGLENLSKFGPVTQLKPGDVMK